MNIGIMQTAYKKASDYGAFYNVQELGLARAFANIGHKVTLVKAVDIKSCMTPSLKTSVPEVPDKIQCVNGIESGDKDKDNSKSGNGDSGIIVRTECEGKLTIVLEGVRYLGINGLISTSYLPKDLDVLIYFCDTQISVSKVYRWCIKNSVDFYPYIGVIESHSENALKRMLMSAIKARDLNIYRKCKVFAKTRSIADELAKLGCNDVCLAAVGLDESVMCKDASKSTYDSGMRRHVERILFVGRMEEEKHPYEMIDIYDRILDDFPGLELTMIGDGYMYEEAKRRLEKVADAHELQKGQARILEKVPYSQMYEHYIWADIYVNLNLVEILGMSILESMYYYCPVLAVDAPGPRYIFGVGGENHAGEGYNSEGNNNAGRKTRDNVSSENKDLLKYSGCEDSENECGILAKNFDELEGMLKEIIADSLFENVSDKNAKNSDFPRNRAHTGFMDNNRYRHYDLDGIALNGKRAVMEHFVWSKIASRILSMICTHNP